MTEIFDKKFEFEYIANYLQWQEVGHHSKLNR